MLCSFVCRSGAHLDPFRFSFTEQEILRANSRRSIAMATDNTDFELQSLFNVQDQVGSCSCNCTFFIWLTLCIGCLDHWRCHWNRLDGCTGSGYQWSKSLHPWTDRKQAASGSRRARSKYQRRYYSTRGRCDQQGRHQVSLVYKSICQAEGRKFR